MTVDRANHASLADLLDRILDKGIVIDAWIRISLAGVDLVGIEARVFVASFDTYLKYAGLIGRINPICKDLAGAQTAPFPQAADTSDKRVA